MPALPLRSSESVVPESVCLHREPHAQMSHLWVLVGPSQSQPLTYILTFFSPENHYNAEHSKFGC